MSIHNPTMREAAQQILTALAAGTPVLLQIETTVNAEDELPTVLQQLHHLATDRKLGILLTPLSATTRRLRFVDS